MGPLELKLSDVVERGMIPVIRMFALVFVFLNVSSKREF